MILITVWSNQKPLRLLMIQQFFLLGKKLYDLFCSVNKELVNIDAWLVANKLSLKIKKTNYILFHTLGSTPPKKHLILSIRNTAINRMSSAKFLGLQLQENLS